MRVKMKVEVLYVYSSFTTNDTAKLVRVNPQPAHISHKALAYAFLPTTTSRTLSCSLSHVFTLSVSVPATRTIQPRPSASGLKLHKRASGDPIRTFICRVPSHPLAKCTVSAVVAGPKSSGMRTVRVCLLECVGRGCVVVVVVVAVAVAETEGEESA